MRPTVFASALIIASGSAFPVLAQDASTGQPFDAAAEVERFFTDTRLVGADSATVASVRADGDTVVAVGISMRWQIPLETPDNKVSIEAAATIPSLRITGLERGADGYSATSMVAPEIAFTFEGRDGDEEPLLIEMKFADYAMQDASWAPFPQIEADPAAPLSRFAPLVNWTMALSYAKNDVARIDTHITSEDGDQTSSYGPFSVGPVANGVLAEMRYPAFSVSQTMEVPDEPDADAAADAPPPMKTVNLTANYGEVVATGIDLRPYAQLLTGAGDLTGPTSILDSFRMDGLSLIFDDATGSFSIGPIVGEGFTVDPTAGPFLEKMDGLVAQILAGGEPDPMTPLMLSLDLYGALGVGRYALTDIAFSNEEVSGNLEEIVVENFSSDGLGRFAINGGAASGAGNAGSLDTFEVRNISFPSRAEFMPMVIGSMMGMPFDPSNLDALPTLGGVTVRGLSTQLPGATGDRFEIGHFDLSLTDYIKGIPTRIAMALDGLSMPASLVDFPPAAMVLTQLGANPVKADAAFDLTWDEDTQNVALDKRLSVAGVGRVNTTAQMSGIPRAIFENITQAQQALATAAVGDITVRYEDEGLVSAVLDMFAKMSGSTAGEFGTGVAGQVEMQVNMMAGSPELARMAGDALRAFLTDPESLTINADPDAPVPVAQLIGAAMTAPAQIANLVKLSISAND